MTNKTLAYQTTTSDCPPGDHLVALCRGTLNDAELETVAGHLAQCDSCQTTLDRIEDEDPFIRRFRPLAAEAIPSFIDESACKRLAARAHKIGIDDTLPLFEDDGDGNVARGAPRPIPETIGRFKVKKLISSGGFADVYLAEDAKLGEVAIKVLQNERINSEAERRRFAEEAHTAENLEHDSIVKVYEVGREDDETQFVVMEYLGGGSLADVLNPEKPLPAKRIVELLVPIARALNYIHQRKDGRQIELVHRDVKPANILLDAEGRPHLADFGLAIAESKRWSHQEELAGTLPYMSPEQVCSDSQHLDGRSDVWSLGVVLYEMLSGRRPFTGRNERQLREEIERNEPKPLSMIDDSINRRLVAVCLKCLATDVTDRYQSAQELAEALQPAQRWKWAVAGLAAAAVVVASSIGAYQMWHAAEDDVVAMRNSRVNLLDRHPKTFMSVPGPNSNVIDYDEDQKRFSVTTPGAGAFSLGKNDSRQFELRCRLSVDNWKDPTTWVAVYWGLRFDENNRSRCHALRFKIDDSGKMNVGVMEYTFAGAAKRSIQQTNPISVGSLRLDQANNVEVEITIRDGKIEELRVQKDTVEIDRLKIAKPLYYAGKIGIICVNGQFVVQDAWLTQLEN